MNTNQFQLHMSFLDNFQSWSNKIKTSDIHPILHYIALCSEKNKYLATEKLIIGWNKGLPKKKKKKRISSSNRDNIIMQEYGWKFQQLLSSVICNFNYSLSGMCQFIFDALFHNLCLKWNKIVVGHNCVVYITNLQQQSCSCSKNIPLSSVWIRKKGDIHSTSCCLLPEGDGIANSFWVLFQLLHDTISNVL